MISSVGTPDPIAMRKLLDYLARLKAERLRKAQIRKTMARQNAHPRRTVKA